jgi:hypothetical protein
MRRLFLMSAACLALCASAAFADDSMMTSRFGNTTVVKTKSGMQVHMYFNADHSFTGKVLKSAITMKGTWVVDGTNICMTYNPALFSVKNPDCELLEAHQVGDTWAAGPRTVSIVAGVQ